MKSRILQPGNVIGILLLVVCFNITQGQGTSTGKRTVPYYISLTKAEPGKVYDVQGEVLDLEYHDHYGTSKEISFKIYDWKHEQVAHAALGKTYGLNHFSIQLRELNASWETGKIYVCRFEDESGRKYELPFRITLPAKTAGPVIDIVVNPITLRCDELSASVVEFYGKIEGGKTPYTVNWVITNNGRTDLLYQPREEIINAPGRSSVITVDKVPDYHVLLQVKDACGNLEQKMVHFICEEKTKKISTIFMEPLQIESTNGQNKGH